VITPKALIFDLDGLLVDSEPIWFEVEGGFLAEFGHIWTIEEAHACMGQGTPNTLRIWKQRYGIPVDIPRDTERIIDRMIARAHEMPLKTGAIQLLEHARQQRCPMAVASSSPQKLISSVLAAKQIDSFFRAIVSGQDVPCSKPAPDVFLRAAECLDIDPAYCVVLEDTLAGTRAGIAAGMRVAAVPSSNPHEIASLATWVLRDLKQAIDVLFGS
jgi:HAD superfamily hydrolase (TIGR01509 family)